MSTPTSLTERSSIEGLRQQTELVSRTGEPRRPWSRPRGAHAPAGRRHRVVAAAMAAGLVAACGSAPDLSRSEVMLGHPVELASGQIRSLDHPDFDHSAAIDAVWTPLVMLQKGGAGIFFLEPYDPNRIPVLFVHGIGGTPQDFRHMIESLDRSRFQAWVFVYPSGFRAKSVVTLLHNLLADLERKHRFSALFITAHSLGSLISCSYVKSGFPESERVKLLVTFSSPWMGHSWAAVGARNMPNAVPSWSDLSPGSEFLVSLREPWSQGSHAPPHYVFFGFHRKASVFIGESSDGVVSESSLFPQWIQDEAERYWGYDVTHVGILSDDAVLERYTALLGSVADRLRVSRPPDQTVP